MTEDNRQIDQRLSEKRQHAIAALTNRNAELEARNQTLTSQHHTLKKNLADCTRLLSASTTGMISLDKTGLINGVNTRAMAMLGAERSYLLKKPISLFIAQQDQALFYINRSRIFAGTHQQPFEINLKTKDGASCLVRVTAQPVETPNQQLPGMLLALEDITAYRQSIEALQLKEYFINLLFSMIDDLSVWPTADIDEIIVYCLEKVGLVSQADRVYVCLFHDRKTRLSVTHEWLSEGIDAPALTDAGVDAFSKVLGLVKKRSTVNVSDIGTLAPIDRAAHEGFHAPGVKAFLFTPLFYGRYLLGIIGCDAVKQTVAWSKESEHLVKCVGGSIVNALIRQRAEKAPPDIRDTILKFIKTRPQTDSDDLFEYEGPIEVMDHGAGMAADSKARWRFEEGEPDDPEHLITALLKDGQTANIACKHCNHQKLLDISEIRTIGTRLKATCTCGNEMYIKVELRREHRKSVRLEGMFIRGRGDRIAMKSDDWGSIRIHNLSRHGIGFAVVGKVDVRVDDRFRVKFTLDNTASSQIQKDVVVRSVADETIGCQFVGHDPCDVTLGFYMMT